MPNTFTSRVSCVSTSKNTFSTFKGYTEHTLSAEHVIFTSYAPQAALNQHCSYVFAVIACLVHEFYENLTSLLICVSFGVQYIIKI